MCSHGYKMPAQQLGVPLNNAALIAMGDMEREFWLDLLMQAKQEIGECDGRDETELFTPTESLSAKYRRALAEFGGERYYQMKQLAEIFNFPA